MDLFYQIQSFVGKFSPLFDNDIYDRNDKLEAYAEMKTKLVWMAFIVGYTYIATRATQISLPAGHPAGKFYDVIESTVRLPLYYYLFEVITTGCLLECTPDM